MKRKTTLRLMAGLAALLMLLTACSNPLDLLEPIGGYDIPRGLLGEAEDDWEGYEGYDARSQYGGYYDRNLINYNDMEYSRPDVEDMKERFESITETVQRAESFDDVIDMDYELGYLWMEFNTMYVLAMLGTYQDYTASFWEAEYEYLVDAGVELETQANYYYAAIMACPFAEDYHEWAGDYYWEYMQNAVRLTSEEVEPYKQARGQLSIQYNNEITDMTFEWQGETLTYDDLDAIYFDQGYSEYYEALTSYYSQNVGTFIDIYTQMIELDKTTAEVLGFDSAAEMYYLQYERDYTPADAAQLCADVRELFADFTPYILSVYPEDVDFDTLMDAMPIILQSVDTELLDAWEDMLYYDLYDFEARDNKQSGIGFTTYISAYDAPFTYAYWDGTMDTAGTVIHEFGHFYDNWLHYDVATSNNLDIAECYSQGLEVLAQQFYAGFTEYPEYSVMYSLADLMQAITYQTLLEEFQLKVYELEELNVETISGLYAELMVDYGYADYIIVDENGLSHSWFNITHLFDYPFYTISYTTSAVVALQIYKESQRDWEAAADLYLDMIHADQLQPFTQLVESVGMKNPTDRATLVEIGEIYRDIFGIEESGAQAA